MLTERPLDKFKALCILVQCVKMEEVVRKFVGTLPNRNDRLAERRRQYVGQKREETAERKTTGTLR